MLNNRKGSFAQNIMKAVFKYSFQWVLGAPLLGLKWLGLEVDQSSSSVWIKNMWSCAFACPCMLMSLCFTDYRFSVIMKSEPFIQSSVSLNMTTLYILL